MQWNNASIDEPPVDRQEILTFVDGVYYMCMYSALFNHYTLRDHPDIFFKPSEYLVYWSELRPQVTEARQSAL